MQEIEALVADLTTHYIEGIAREGNVPFRVSLISHVEGNLWQGGYIPGARLPDDFAFVVSLYPWGRYEIGPETVRVEAEMYDAGSVPDERVLRDLARMINAFRAKGKTLVHCQAGLNRSALIAGLALVLNGMPAPDAIRLLRQRRCSAVLCNKAFEAWLLAQVCRGSGRSARTDQCL